MTYAESQVLISEWDLEPEVDARPKPRVYTSEENEEFLRFLQNCIVHPELERELDKEEIESMKELIMD